MNIEQPKIDGLHLYEHIGKDNGKAVVLKDRIKDDTIIKDEIGIICRKPYKEIYNNDKTDFELLELYNYISYSNTPNCYVYREKSYPRCDPNKISYIYLLRPLRNIDKGQFLTVAPNTLPLENIKVSHCEPLRSQPDYMERNYQEQAKNITSEVYDIMRMANIVRSVYKTIK